MHELLQIGRHVSQNAVYSVLSYSVYVVAGIRFNPGQSFNVTLNAFEVIALRSVGDLTGAELMSNDKVDLSYSD